MTDKVVYFTGCFANYYAPETAKALVAIMEKNGCAVIVPEQACCGMPMLANGNSKGARKNFTFIVQSLARAAAPGYPIVTTCPSCNMMLRKDGPLFFASEEAEYVAEHLYDAEEYLLGLHRQGRLNKNFGTTSLKVFYHNPCHLQVQNIIQAPLDLLALIPGLSITGVNAACCGMGGSYGLKKLNYERSRQIAGKVWNEVKAAQADILVTECGGCSLQIQAGTGIPSSHPLVILNQAYEAGTRQ